MAGGKKKRNGRGSGKDEEVEAGGAAAAASSSAAADGDDDGVPSVLTDGMERFSLSKERSLEDQMASLTDAERACVDELKARWEKKARSGGITFTDEWYLRFARCSPGDKKFNVKASVPVMKNFAPWAARLNLMTQTADDLAAQLRTKTLLIPPGLRSRDGHDFLYMRPGRYFPEQTSTDLIIKNLVYLLDCMCMREKACTEGIAFMANMEGWGWPNWSVSYCKQFMDTMQGRFPVRVRLFLIVNPPSWFGAIWRMMRPMLSKEFAAKIHMIRDTELPAFLHPESGPACIPDEFGGEADTDQLVNDFIGYRKFVEAGHEDIQIG